MPMHISRLLHVSLVVSLISPFYIPYSPRKRNERLLQLQLSLHIITVGLIFQHTLHYVVLVTTWSELDSNSVHAVFLSRI
jgi:hypothetical protein